MLKEILKRNLIYRPLEVTAPVRAAVDSLRRDGFPSCPPDEGDLLYLLANACPDSRCLEVGFATGSTALYMLAGSKAGSVTSIDYRQSEFDYVGVRAVAQSGMAGRHKLLEGNSNTLLPELFRSSQQFDLIFLDGWKTFDHLWVDAYYCNQLLALGGVMVFDDTRMPSVDKALRLLHRYYQYEEIDGFRLLAWPRLRWWYLLTTRTYRRPYRVFRKTRRYEDLAVSRDWSYWRNF